MSQHCRPTKKGPMTLPKPTHYTLSTAMMTTNGAGQKKESQKDPLQVYCRIRPLKSLTELIVLRKETNNILRITHPNKPNDLYYNFKNIFSEVSTQKEVFDEVAYPLVKDLIYGKDGLLFTYGITSSGKTHTLTGNPQNPGILSRSLDTIFNTIQGRQCRKFTFKPDGQNGFEIRTSVDAILEEQKEDLQRQRQFPLTTLRTPMKRRNMNCNGDEFKDWDKREKEESIVDLPDENNNLFSVFVSYVEVYNNYIYDLLDDTVFDQIKLKQPQSKALREDSRKKVFVSDGAEIEVKNATEANELFIKGIKRRRIAQTNLNAESSRSHSMFSIKLVQAPKDKDEEIVTDPKFMTISQLSLVDLAGSERAGRTQTSGDRLKEASKINNSLMSLRNCIDILRENQHNNQIKFVPYRDNKLTHLFKTYFEGEGQIKMIICVSPGSDDYLETLQVMKFAEAAQEVMVKKATNAPLFLTYQFGHANPFNIQYPSTTFADADDDKIFPDWMEAMDQRQKIKASFWLLLEGNLDSFRNILVEMENENMVAKQQVSMYKNDLEARLFQNKRLEEQLAGYKKTIENYKHKSDMDDNKIVDLENELHQKELLLNKHNVEISKIRADLNEKYNTEHQRMKMQFRQALKDKQGKIERELCLQKEKAELVREILNGDLNLDFLRECRDSLCPGSVETMPKMMETNTPVHPNTKLSTNFATPKPSSAIPQPSAYTNNSRTPISNPRHRRSLSSGNERWINHKPLGTIDLGTVFKPEIKNCKSISNLTEISKEKLFTSSNYALTHHVATPDGDVETHVYKGDIIPTALGGAQVVFNDVETLRQFSPQNRKRSSTSSHVIGIDKEMMENLSPVKPSPTKRNRKF